MEIKSGADDRSMNRQSTAGQDPNLQQDTQPEWEGEAMGNPIVYFEISSKDCKQLESFYSAIFDWETTP